MQIMPQSWNIPNASLMALAEFVSVKSDELRIFQSSVCLESILKSCNLHIVLYIVHLTFSHKIVCFGRQVKVHNQTMTLKYVHVIIHKYYNVPQLTETNDH